MSEEEIKIIDVNEENISETGFFCFAGRTQTEGYQRKLRWLKARFTDGLKLKIIAQGGRGFIEYVPAAVAYRPSHVHGPSPLLQAFQPFCRRLSLLFKG